MFQYLLSKEEKPIIIPPLWTCLTTRVTLIFLHSLINNNSTCSNIFPRPKVSSIFYTVLLYIYIYIRIHQLGKKSTTKNTSKPPYYYIIIIIL